MAYFRGFCEDNVTTGEGGGEGEGGRVLSLCMAVVVSIDPRIPTMPGRSTSVFHQPGRHCLHQEGEGGGGRDN